VLECSVASLAAGESFEVAIDIDASSPWNGTLTGSVSANESDPETANGSATLDTALAARTDLSLFDPSHSVDRLVSTMDAVLFNGTASERTLTELTAFLRGGKLNKHRIRDAVGLAVASPEFQQY